MANELAVAYVSLLPETSKIAPGLRQAMGGPSVAKAADEGGQSAGKRFGGAMKGALKKAAIFTALGAAAAGAGIVKVMGDSIKAASDAQQSVGATETVFAKASDQIMRKSRSAAKAYGLSANEYRENANLIGSLFKNQGVATDQLASKSDKMIGVAADLAATFGGDTKTAVEALGSAFKGEFDPLEQYGISIKQSTINTAAMAVAGVKTTAQFDALSKSAQTQAKQQATTNLILKQSKDSLGAFGRESDTLAHQQQVLAAQFEDVKNQVGKFLLPILTKLGQWLTSNVLPAVEKFIAGMRNGTGAGGKFADKMRDLWARTKETFGYVKANVLPVLGRLLGFLYDNRDVLVAVGAGLLAAKVALVGYNAYVKISTAVTKGWTIAQKLLNGTMKANPIGIVITLIALLVAGFVLAYKRSETFRKIVDAAWRGIKAAASAVVKWFVGTAWPWLKRTFGFIGSAVKTLFTAYFKVYFGLIKAAFKAISVAATRSWDGIKKVFGWLKSGVSAVKDGFGKAKDGIARIWGGLTDALKRPVTAALSWLSDHFAKPINSLLSKVGLSFRLPTFGGGGQVPFRAGSLTALPRRADGGTIPGPYRGARADNVLGISAAGVPTAMVNPNEFIQPVDAVKHYGVGFMEAIRQKKLPKFGIGGLIGSAWGGLKSAVNSVWSAINPLERLKHLASRLIGDAPESLFARVAVGVAKKVTGGLGGALKGMFTGAGGPHMGGSWQSLWSMVQPWGAILTSAVRPGARTQFGNLSRHAMGKAIDIAPNLEIFKRLYAMRGRFYELLSPWGMWLRGQPYHNAAVQSIHRDHIHVSTYDQGGVLKPGYTLAYNGTGKNETIRTSEQESALGMPQRVRLVVDGYEFNAYVDARANGQIGRHQRRVAGAVS